MKLERTVVAVIRVCRPSLSYVKDDDLDFEVGEAELEHYKKIAAAVVAVVHDSLPPRDSRFWDGLGQ